MEQSAIDQVLIRHYGNQTPIEIGRLTGLEPMEVAKRTEQLLGERDYLNEEAKLLVLQQRIEWMSAEIESRLPNMSDDQVSKAVNSASSALARVLKELRELRRESKVDVNAITQNQGRVLGEIVDIAMRHLRDELKERYGTTDEEMDVLVLEGIVKAQDVLEGKVNA